MARHKKTARVTRTRRPWGDKIAKPVEKLLMSLSKTAKQVSGNHLTEVLYKHLDAAVAALATAHKSLKELPEDFKPAGNKPVFAPGLKVCVRASALAAIPTAFVPDAAKHQPAMVVAVLGKKIHLQFDGGRQYTCKAAWLKAVEA
jgi:hypothetical protein